MKNATGIKNLFTEGAAAQQIVNDMVNGFEANKATIDQLLEDVYAKFLR